MKNDRDLVSVIIPTYNRAQLCKSAVESALSQTHGNVEVLVIDDGSTDNTREVISGIDNRVKYLYQANAGVSAARNTGLMAATGDYVAFLDSDDAWLPWKLEAQLSVFKSFPDAGMVWTNMKAVDENGAVLHESFLELMYGGYKDFDRETHFRENRLLSDVWDECPSVFADKKCYTGNIFSRMFLGSLVHTSTVLLRRDRQQKVGLFDVSLIKLGEDYDYHFRTCRVGDVAYLDAPSILYRIGADDQLTAQENTIYIARSNLVTLNKALSENKNEIDLPLQMIRSRMAWSYAWVGLYEFDENPSKARPYLIQSLRLSPLQAKVAVYLLLSFLPPGSAEKLRGIKNLFKTGAKTPA